jgi:hypothetical protein
MTTTRAKTKTKTKDVSIPLTSGGRVTGRLTSAVATPRVAIALAHGAGSDLDARLLVAVADGLAARGHAVLRFNFPYKERGGKAPDKAPTLEATWRDVAAWLRPRAEKLVIGGKSMGGRYASIVASKGLACGALVFLGYPLHPATKKGAKVDPAKLRDAHLPLVAAPMLFVSGTKDPLCDLALLRPVLARVGPRAELVVVDGADHDLGPPRSKANPRDANDAAVIAAVDAFLSARV